MRTLWTHKARNYLRRRWAAAKRETNLWGLPHVRPRDRHPAVQAMTGDRIPAYRCSLCAINWHYGTQFQHCRQCGHKTDPIRDVPAAEVMSHTESAELARKIAMEEAEAQELARQQAILDKAALERRTSAAVAALHYDFDHAWGAADPATLADWAGEATC